jgi:PfaB family protein
MMQTDRTIADQRMAIVGMDACFSSDESLAAFERSIYEGKNAECSTSLSSTEILERFDRVARIAFEDAAINSDINIAIVVAKDSQQKFDSNVNSNVIEVDSIFEALLMAQKLLNGTVEAVLVGGIDFESQAVGALVLKRYQTAKSDWRSHAFGDRHKIYAVINIPSLATATIQAQEITYLELVGDRRLEEINIDKRIPNYLAAHLSYSCAVSSAVNTGYKGIAAEIASLIKTSLCLYYRYIPPVPQWHQGASKGEHPFYVATEAKPWFLEAGISKRVAAIDNLRDSDALIILSEVVTPQRRSNAYLEQTPGYLFPLAANDSKTLLARLGTLKQTIADGDLAKIAQLTFANYQAQEANYALAIVGKNKPEILRECDRAAKGVTNAFETGKDWQTPVGSYFTANPQGKKGKLAYVYPGAYNAHLGLGKDLFRLFPNLIDEPVIKSTCNRIAGIEKLLYPRSWHKLSPRELETKERELMNDPLAMLESETGFAGFITTILRDYFQLKPQAAFGYSLGETSMMYAQGVWGDIDRSSDVINTSPLFKTRLAGNKEAVREYWQLSEEQSGELWRTYVVMANSDVIKEKLRSRSVGCAQSHQRVFLTQISTPNEAVIAGDPQSCERVIASLGCDAFRAPFNHVIHCDAMKSEYNELIKLNTLPLRKSPEITFYSAAKYQEILHTTPEIAHSLTQTLCQQLDFPRLVNRVYQDNYRIFVEVGVGSNCSRWIKDILKSKEHATVSLHRRGTNDFTSLIKAIAKLLSHRAQLDLSPLYDQEHFHQDPTVVNPVNRQTKLDNHLIPWQPSLHNTLGKFKNGLSVNNSHLSKAQAIAIACDKEYLLNSQKAIGIHLEVLEKIISESYLNSPTPNQINTKE